MIQLVKLKRTEKNSMSCPFTLVLSIYLNIRGNSFSSSSLLPSVAKQKGRCFSDEITCSLLNGARASLTIDVAFVLERDNHI